MVPPWNFKEVMRYLRQNHIHTQVINCNSLLLTFDVPTWSCCRTFTSIFFSLCSSCSKMFNLWLHPKSKKLISPKLIQMRSDAEIATVRTRNLSSPDGMTDVSYTLRSLYSTRSPCRITNKATKYLEWISKSGFWRPRIWPELPRAQKSQSRWARTRYSKPSAFRMHYASVVRRKETLDL